MGFVIKVDDSRAFVRVTIEGDVTAEFAREFTLAADAVGKKEGIDRYLVDSRTSRNILSASDNYYYAYREMNGMQLSRAARSAILVDPEDKSHDFVETVSQNAGFNVRVFRDEQEAIAWLREKD